jgi:hypothetical protein
VSVIPFVGYAKLRPGRIHLYCPKCGRRMSNADREATYDPPDAVLSHVWCCGDSDGPPRYFDADGVEIDYWAWWDAKHGDDMSATNPEPETKETR